MIMLESQGISYLLQNDYTKAINWYENQINDQPDDINNYWYLGLVLLLEGREEEAQTTWLWVISEAEPTEIENWTDQLIKILEIEAERRTSLQEYKIAWIIRQHIKELVPNYVNNLLKLVDLSIAIDNCSSQDILDWNLISELENQSTEISNLDQNLLLHTLQKVLQHLPCAKISLELTRASTKHIQNVPLLIEVLIPIIYEIAYSWKALELAKNLAEVLLELAPERRELLRTVSQFATDLCEHDKAIKCAEKSYQLSEEIFEKVIDSHGLMRAMIAAKGYSQEVIDLGERHKELLHQFLRTSPDNLGLPTMRFYNSCFFFPYIEDNPQANLELRSQVAKFCCSTLQKSCQEEFNKYREGLQARKLLRNLSDRPLRIGYLSHTMRRHSVGWLARWLFEHHDRNKFEIYSYMLGAAYSQDPLRQWYIEHSHQSYTYGTDTVATASQIYEDQIDILIDLDSVTLTNTALIIALKPAPIQVTWLGWDASCMPTIDYYIADPYVLPDNAEIYYPEKIYRLPNTYLAVDGFEVHMPSLRRDELNIPTDSVIYFAAQRGFKYNPNFLKLQMTIIKEVPNSYLLMKGFGSESFFLDALKDVAESVGISIDRLRFIDEVDLEEIHRANLGIADVMLDTYPYNGATTTLESLWMCVPIVTRVGEQFAARNSYTMMINAGITEGIAWTDEEYVEWGIRLGKDENLRKQIYWKLRKNRQTAPLWNGKQFTQDMEVAYRQMWKNYIES